MKLLNIALLYCSPSLVFASETETGEQKLAQIRSMSEIRLEKNLTPGDHRHRH